MKNVIMWTAGIAGVSIAGYMMLNKKTRKKAEELFVSMMDEADKAIKNIKE